MSKVKYIYRRAKRKMPCNNSATHAKQSSAFFEFGGEQSFFSAKNPEAETGKADKDNKHLPEEVPLSVAEDYSDEKDVSNDKKMPDDKSKDDAAGKDGVVFDAGKYNLVKDESKDLLAHELTRVAQQNSVEVKKEPQEDVVKKEPEISKKEKESERD